MQLSFYLSRCYFFLSLFFSDMDLSDGHAMMHWENKNKNQSSEREEH
jgi:hypothetical protein